MSKQILSRYWAVALLPVFLTAHADYPSLCDNPEVLLSLVDRPTFSLSACVVPLKHVVLENGYQYANFTPGPGQGSNFPESELRVGFPGQNEFIVFFPNYNSQTESPKSGSKNTTLGVKHQLVARKTWAATLSFLLSQPNGSSYFGSAKGGYSLSANIASNITERLNVLFQVDFTRPSLPSAAGGERYTSINPDIDFSYSLTPLFETYIEFYGLGKTAPDEGSALGMDTGFLYLPFPWLEMDAEYGQRLYGNFGNIQNYVGVGVSFLFF